MRTVAAICQHLTHDRRTDGELLAAFASERSEAAFLELVRRHGPLVWGTCRRLLPDPADAEDAFQAAFLVLVRQARRLTHNGAIGPWLHRVAVLTARNSRRKNARRLARQQPLSEHISTSAPNGDLKADIDSALLALPARYRDSIILCHLQGFSRREAAERLGCAEGTLSAWLNRGLAKLRTRLHSLDPAKVLGALAVTVPATLVANTAHAALATSVAAATLPPAISSLVEGVVHMFWIKKATAAAFSLCAVFALGMGVGLGTRPSSTGVAAQDGAPATGAAKPKAAPAADPANDIAALEQAIRAREVEHQGLLNATKLIQARSDAARKNFDSLKAAATPDALDRAKKLAQDMEDALRMAPHYQKLVDESAAELQQLKDKLAKLKGDKAASSALTANAGADLNKELVELKRQIEALAREKEVMVEQTTRGLRRVADLDAALRDYQRRAEQIAARDKRADAKPNGYLELAVAGHEKQFQFVIREVPPDQKGRAIQKQPLGPITTSDPAALAKLLARAKADPNGPQEVHVIVQPQATLGSFPAAALEACDAAGYKTVAFTGYVFGGGFATQLKSDQTGDVRGYKRYDNAEVKPKQLAEEIKEGLSRL